MWGGGMFAFELVYMRGFLHLYESKLVHVI